MLDSEVFLEIPVYRCTSEQHQKEMEIEKNKSLEYLEKKGFTRQENPNVHLRAENQFNDNKWYLWCYNEIIGWIQLFVCGRQIRGEYWWVSSKKITRRGRKVFYYGGKAFESMDIMSENSDQIFIIICENINQLSRERPFKGRYIDMKLLLNLGSYINWRDLFEDLKFPQDEII